jgi:glycosyltransferase involved in cell wall biosynthesis
MRIGFDVTALYVAQAGIFYYDYNLIRTLLKLDRDNDYLLLDYSPIHGGNNQPNELRALENSTVGITHVTGLRHRKLARLKVMQRPVLWPLARLIDRTLLWPWKSLAQVSMRRRLSPLLTDVDVFHSSEVLLWRQPGALNITTIYDLTPILFPEYHTPDTLAIQRAKHRFAQEEADVVIAISEATKRDIITHLGIAEDRIRVVYAGVAPYFQPVTDPGIMHQALSALRLTPGEYLLHVGTLEPRKNLRRLIEAYALLLKEASEPVPELILVGAVGWNYQEILVLVEALALQDKVRYVGRLPAEVLPALYSGARVFVYPSLYEGFGLPPLEAMACGVPVITSNTSSLPEVVGDAGVTVSPTDTVALAEALADLLFDTERRQSLREAGLARARKFSWERAARETLAVYQRSVNAKGGG